MTIDGPTLINAALALGALVLSIWSRVVDKSGDNAAKIAVIEDRVQTLWLAWLRRGIVEGIHNDMFTVNSPTHLLPKSARMFATMITDLRAWYRLLPDPMTDPEIQERIEKQFGERIVKEVCIPNNIHNASCLHSALELCRIAEEDLRRLIDLAN